MPDLLYEKFDHYAVFTMNRPERLNALGGSLRAEQAEALNDFTSDNEMRVGIVTGAGRAFSAGMDLKEAAERVARGESAAGTAFNGQIMPHAYGSNPKPFIAAINGLAVGGGLETALGCDIRIMSSEAYVGLYEAKRGIIPGPGLHLLPRLIGLSGASQLLLTADRVDPEQALQWGIVTEVVEPDRLIPRAIELAQMIASNAPLSVAATKAQIQHWSSADLSNSFRLYQWIAEKVFSSEDSKEGPTAFAEKRTAIWQGR